MQKIFKIQDFQKFISLTSDWFFLKLEIMNLFREIYILNSKISDEEEKEIFAFFSEFILLELKANCLSSTLL
jgi:hypothetical protein